MRVAKYALLQLFLCLILAGCGGGSRQGLITNSADFPMPSRTDITQELRTDYQFGPFDRIKVTVYRVPDLSNEYRIEPSGVVEFPLIGSMKVSGMTSTQLSQNLRQSYGERYLENPDISVQLVEAIGNEVTVEGSVRTPTVYTIFGESNLVQAVAKGGGLNDEANASRVLVFRKIDGVQKVAMFSLKDIREGRAENPLIYGGDIVVVDGSTVKQAFKQILQGLPLFATFIALVR